MRNVNRIYKFCEEFADIWASKCPDWRFFQIISNICRSNGSDLFYCEEDKAMKLIKEYFNVEEKEANNEKI